MSRTLVVVTCKRDQWNFDLLCRSLGKYVEPCKIIFIYNENVEEFRSWQKVFKLNYLPYITKFDITLMTREQFWTQEITNHLIDLEKCGWVDQQILKLAVANFVSTEEYIVLDAKNFFISKTYIESIEQIKSAPTGWCDQILKNWIVTCCETFSLEVPSTPIKLTQNTTPYLIRTQSAKELIDFFGGIDFLFKWFTLEARKEKHSPSEFFLYEIYTMRYGYRNLGSTLQNCISFWEFMHTKDRWRMQDYLKYINTSKEINKNISVAGIHGGMRKFWTCSFATEILKNLDCGDIIPDGMPFIKDR